MADTTAAPLSTRPQPYTFDLGHLLVFDPTPLPSLADPSTTEAVLSSTAQACAQALINQLLTACPIARNNDGDLQIKLPAPETRLPREKPVPKIKEKTKWEKFAAKKGIGAKRKDGGVKFDEEKGGFAKKYGYKGKSGDGPGEWLEEVDEKGEKKAKAGKDGQRKTKEGRVMRVAHRK